MVVDIFIRGLDGKIYEVYVDEGTTVLDLKHKIQHHEGIPESRLRLIFESKQLEDDFLLSDYGIQNKATIHTMLRCPGGGRPGGPEDPGMGDKDGKNRSMELRFDF